MQCESFRLIGWHIKNLSEIVCTILKELTFEKKLLLESIELFHHILFFCQYYIYFMVVLS